MRLVYVSGPIGAGPGVEDRIANGLVVTADLLRAGFAVASPFCMAASLPSHLLTYDEWMAVDLALLERCDAVLRMPGHSPGADEEEAHARHHGIPVFDSLDALIFAARMVAR